MSQYTLIGTHDALQGLGTKLLPVALENIMKLEMTVLRVLFAASSLTTMCGVFALVFGWH